MKLSQINNKSPNFAYGLELDNVPDNIPSNLVEVSIKCQFSKENVLDPSFMANFSFWLIKSQAQGISTILEVESCPQEMLPTLILMAINMDVNLSLLPPKNPTQDDEVAYTNLCIDASKLIFNAKGGCPFVFPVCNYLEYLALLALNNSEGLEPTDDYTNMNFKEKMSERFIDSFKASLSESIYHDAGGRDEFEKSVKLLAKATISQLEGQLFGK